ncbi:ATP-dependent dethiobiotin synthetase BioD [Planctomycetales bacterium]|nr:ATP-dependent dethiobiotin synthetase BioD [Planctomycetales bacterium]
MPAIFITGTGTDAGKTYFAALLVKALRAAGLNAGYYKAAVSGNTRDASGRLIAGDAERVVKIAGLSASPNSLVSYIYEAAVSPHLAARLEGTPPELAKIRADYARLCREYAYVVVEGSGGIVCPLRRDGRSTLMLSEVIKELQLATVVVGTVGLGAINNFVLTAEYLQRHGIVCRGLVFNRFIASGGAANTLDAALADTLANDNMPVIAEITGLPVWGVLAPDAQKIELTPDISAIAR